jgi:hypothetical protein
MTREDHADRIFLRITEAIGADAPFGLRMEERDAARALAWKVTERFRERPVLRLGMGR